MSQRDPLEQIEETSKLLKTAPFLLMACKEFVRRVEAGEVRSKRTYSQMKQAIEIYETGKTPNEK